MNLQYRPVRGRTRDVHSSSLLIDVYALFLTLVSDGRLPMTQAEKFPDPFLLKSDVNLSNHLLESGCCGLVVLRVLFFVDMRLPVFSVARFVLSEVVFTLLMQIN